MTVIISGGFRQLSSPQMIVMHGGVGFVDLRTFPVAVRRVIVNRGYL